MLTGNALASPSRVHRTVPLTSFGNIILRALRTGDVYWASRFHSDGRDDEGWSHNNKQNGSGRESSNEWKVVLLELDWIGVTLKALIGMF